VSARGGAPTRGPRELVVLSGKGGTGKTSLVASFAVLAPRVVVADCDVDAADLHLVLGPRVRERHEFRSGEEAFVREEDCTGCGDCLALCRFGAVRKAVRGARGAGFRIDPLACEGCGVCARFCPVEAIEMRERVCGEWMVSETRRGPLVHAVLAIGSGSSGKLVSTVRQAAARLAVERGSPLVITDGPPGIGCPAIAAVTGASRVLAVTEPTVSGEHDLERLLALTRHFDVPVSVCVNKWDVNPGMTERIERGARRAGADAVGRVRYDPAVSRAQVMQRTIVETDAAASDDVRRLWERLRVALDEGHRDETGERERGGSADEHLRAVEQARTLLEREGLDCVGRREGHLHEVAILVKRPSGSTGDRPGRSHRRTRRSRAL
jgi:MinD superfamily P-loop ATPase